MPDVTMTVRDATRNLTSAPNFTANGQAATSADNYFFQNDGRTVLLVAAGTAATVVVETTATVDAQPVTDLTLALANTNVRVIGPFPPAVYNDALGRCKVTVSAACTLFPLRVP